MLNEEKWKQPPEDLCAELAAVEKERDQLRAQLRAVEQERDAALQGQYQMRESFNQTCLEYDQLTTQLQASKLIDAGEVRRAKEQLAELYEYMPKYLRFYLDTFACFIPVALDPEVRQHCEEARDWLLLFAAYTRPTPAGG